MNTIPDFVASILGQYDFTVNWDIPYITSAVLLVLGVWFSFKVILVLMHMIGGGKSR